MRLATRPDNIIRLYSGAGWLVRTKIHDELDTKDYRSLWRQDGLVYEILSRLSGGMSGVICKDNCLV